MRNKRFMIILLTMLLGISLTGCGSSKAEQKYAEDLNNGLQKYSTGGSMTKDEYNAVKSYNKWLDRQENTTKTYSQWDNN